MTGEVMTASDDDWGPAERALDTLKRIARYQRWLVAVVLAQLALWGGFVGLLFLSDGAIGPRFPVVLTFVLGGVGAVYVVLLSWELRGPFAAVLLSLATVPPCLGLFILTLVNGYATAELRRHGVRVGVFGTSERSVTERPSLYDDEDAGW